MAGAGHSTYMPQNGPHTALITGSARPGFRNIMDPEMPCSKEGLLYAEAHSACLGGEFADLPTYSTVK